MKTWKFLHKHEELYFYTKFDGKYWQVRISRGMNGYKGQCLVFGCQILSEKEPTIEKVLKCWQAKVNRICERVLASKAVNEC